MATAKNKAAKSTARLAIVPDPRDNGIPGAAGAAASVAAPPNERPKRKKDSDDDLVSVTIPKAFKLTDNSHREHSYEPGYADIPREHAEHWYAKACGVLVNED